MTGVDILSLLLRAHLPLIGIVPAAQIRAGRFPERQPLPGLLLRTVSSRPRDTLRSSDWVRFDSRISAAVRAESYRDADQVMTVLERFRRDFIAQLVDGQRFARRISILPAGRGPDLNGPNNSFEQTHDFRVSFETPA